MFVGPIVTKVLVNPDPISNWIKTDIKSSNA